MKQAFFKLWVIFWQSYVFILKNVDYLLKLVWNTQKITCIIFLTTKAEVS